jgi:cell division transport system permease protein
MSFFQKIPQYLQAIKDFFSEWHIDFLKKSFTTSFQNIQRNRLISLSSVFILTLMLILFHSSMALKFFANESLISLNKKVDLILEIKNDQNTADIILLQENIEQEPGVISVQFISQEQALKQFLLKHENIKKFLDKYQLKNPLPGTLEIQTQTPQDLQILIQSLESSQYTDIIHSSAANSDIEQKSRIEKLIHLGNFIQKISFIFLLVFIVIAVLIIFNTITVVIHSRKDEIYNMYLVGATKQFIQAPFIFEGILYSLFSLFFAIIIELLLHFQISYLLQNTLENSPLIEGMNTIMGNFLYQYPTYIFFEALLLIICSIIASFIAIELYLRKISL